MPNGARRATVVLLTGCLALAGVSVVSAGAAVKKVKPVAYNIGIISTTGGTSGTTLSVVTPTFEAWVSATNASGGIGATTKIVKGHRVVVAGHKIKLFQATDTDAASALTAVQNLVKSDHIIALFDNSTEDYSFEAYVDSINLPVVGTEYNGKLMNTDKNWHTVGSVEGNLGINLLTVIQASAKTKVSVLYCAEYAACNNVGTLFDPYLTQTGTSLVYVAAISGSAPNYTANCLAAQQAGATWLVIFEPGPIAQKVVDNCVAQGYSPLVVSTSSLAIAAWLTDPNMNGTELFSPLVPDFVSNTPATKAEFAALGKYQPSVLTSQYFSEEVPNAWVSGKALQLAMTNGKMGNHPSAAGVVKGFDTFKNETFGGMSSPNSNKDGQTIGSSCVFTEVISKGAYVLNNGLNLSCPGS